LSAAVALAHAGVRAAVFERASAPNDHPRAHVVNPRSMEIFRLWGIEDAVRAAALPPEATGNFVWMTSLAGETLGEVRYETNANAARDAATLTPEVSCAQDLVEQILRERLVGLGAERVRFAAAVTDLRQDGDGVRLAINGRADAVTARFAIAADGAGSATRQRLGIGMDGPDELARFLAIYLHADLRDLTGARPSVLYWIVNSAVQGVFISMNGGSRFTFHVRVDPTDDGPFTVERCRGLIHAAIGRDDIEPDIRQVGQWVMSGQVAERYRAGDVLLVGDAAHRFPPTGGFGMNTGIQDVHNLAWKIAAVLDGWAPEALLDTYELERRPVADANRWRSVSNFERLERLACWSRDPLPIVGRLEGGGETAIAERERFRREVARQRDHFDKIDQELGFAYDAGALAADTTGDTDSAPNARLGARAPLALLERPGGGVVATTDLFGHGFVLLADGECGWRDAALTVGREGVAIDCLVVGEDLVDRAGDWAKSYGLPSGGAVLVRPDGHVAFRSNGQDPCTALRAAMREILRADAA